MKSGRPRAGNTRNAPKPIRQNQCRNGSADIFPSPPEPIRRFVSARSGGKERPMKAAIYARVSTLDQHPENQLQELRRYVEARGWTSVGSTSTRASAAPRNVGPRSTTWRDAKRRRFDVLVCWRLDRLGRNLKHLITLLDELQSTRGGVRRPRRGHRRHHARRQAPDAHPRRDRRVRAGTDHGTRSGRARESGSPRKTPRPPATDHQPGATSPGRPNYQHATGGDSARRVPCRRTPGHGLSQNPSQIVLTNCA